MLSEAACVEFGRTWASEAEKEPVELAILRAVGFRLDRSKSLSCNWHWQSKDLKLFLEFY